MNAVKNGFGYVVPMPYCFQSQLGGIVYIGEDGVVEWVGYLFDDGHFQSLANTAGIPLEISSTEEPHPGLSVAFATGSIDVEPLSEEDSRRSTSTASSEDSDRNTGDIESITIGWLLKQRAGQRGRGDAIILGPNLRKHCLNIPKDLVLQWVKEASKKSTLWTGTNTSLFPKHRLLVVLEEWTTATWTRVQWNGKEGLSQRLRIGLTVITDDPPTARQWRILGNLPENSPVTTKVGNNTSIERWIVAVGGIPLDLDPSRVKSSVVRFRNRVGRLLAPRPESQARGRLGRLRRSYKWAEGKLDNFPRLRLKPRATGKIGEKVRGMFSGVKEKFQKKKKLNNLGIVSKFVSQNIEESGSTEEAGAELNGEGRPSSCKAQSVQCPPKGEDPIPVEG